jgi:membrane protein YqaA with SNARE-associated domain
MFDWSGDTSLAALFIAAFASATLLPANSELVLVAVLRAHPDLAFAAIALATLGNTLGGLTTYAIGRLLPQKTAVAVGEGEENTPPPLGEGRVRVDPRALALMRRHGAWALLLSWVPILGDALCAAAGWLRVPFAWSLAAIAFGKLARYIAVAYLVTLA